MGDLVNENIVSVKKEKLKATELRLWHHTDGIMLLLCECTLQRVSLRLYRELAIMYVVWCGRPQSQLLFIDFVQEVKNERVKEKRRKRKELKREEERMENVILGHTAVTVKTPPVLALLPYVLELVATGYSLIQPPPRFSQNLVLWVVWVVSL